MELLEQVESYLAQTKVPPSTFGRMAVGDPRFVQDLRLGRRLRRKTQERVRRYLTRAQSGVTSRTRTATWPRTQSKLAAKTVPRGGQ